MANRPITACLIGVSGFAAAHYGDLLRQQERGRMRLLGATVINPDQEPEKCERLRAIGCEIFGDHLSMLDRLGAETDLCFIPTGISLHAPMTIAALKAGANVLVEKPAAATIQDVLAMEACEAETGRFVAVGFQTIYGRETLWMKRAILNGEIGDVVSIKCRALWPRTGTYYKRNSWAGHLRTNGDWVLDSPFNNAVAHQLNMLLFLAGTHERHSADILSVEAELYRVQDIESADTGCIRVVTRTHLPLFFYASHSAETVKHPDIHVRGTKGSIRWYFHHRACIERADGSQEDMLCDIVHELRDIMVAKVCDRLTDPNVFTCDLRIARSHTLAVNGAHDSSPIHALDESCIERIPDEEVRHVLRGIDGVIDAACEKEELFHEMGVPWSKPSKKVMMEGYTYFPGGSIDTPIRPQTHASNAHTHLAKSSLDA